MLGTSPASAAEDKLEPASQPPAQSPTEQAQKDQTIDAVQQFKQGNHLPLCMVAEQLGPEYLVESVPLIHLLARVFIPMRTVFPSVPSRLPVSQQGQCPLFIAINNRNTDSVIYMLKASPAMVVDKWHYSAITYALREQYLVGFVLCLTFGHRSALLPHMAAMKDDRWAIELLHTLEFSLTEHDGQGNTPFTLAVRHLGFNVLDYMSSKAAGCIMINHPMLLDLPAPSVRGRIRDNLAAREWQVLLQEVKNYFNWDYIRLSMFTHLAAVFLMVLTLATSRKSHTSLTEGLLMGLAVICLTWGFFLFGGKGSRLVDPAACKRSFFQLVSGRHDPSDPVTAFHKVRALADGNEVTELDRLDVRDICPKCLIFREEAVHCEECGECVRGWHFHWLGKCINRKNHCFYLAFLTGHLYFLHIFFAALDIETPESYWLHSLAVLHRLGWLSRAVFAVAWAAWGWFVLELGVNLFCVVNGMTYDEVLHPQRYKRLYQLVTVGESSIFTRQRWLDRPLKFPYLRNIFAYLRDSLSRGD